MTVDDLGGAPFDLMVLDCHHYPATKRFLMNVLKWDLLSPDGMLFLHDTGRHSTNNRTHPPVDPPAGRAPPCDVIVMWLERYDCASKWQRLVVHDDFGRGATILRHGVTVLQRKVSLAVPRDVCEAGAHGFGGTGPETPQECMQVQAPRTACSKPS